MKTMPSMPAADGSTWKVADLVAAMNRLADPDWAESWDNVGLLLGDPGAPLRRVLLTLDLTAPAMKQAQDIGADLILTHHPAIFTSLSKLTAGPGLTGRLWQLARAGKACLAAHTNLDAAPQGVSAALADRLGLTGCQVTIAWPGAADAAARGIGYGRTGVLTSANSRFSFTRRINQRLETAGCFLNFDHDAEIHRIAVFGGSFDGEWLEALSQSQVDMVVAGEIKHHHLLALRDYGIAAVAAGHEATERVVWPSVGAYLSRCLPGLEIDLNQGLDYNTVVAGESQTIAD